MACVHELVRRFHVDVEYALVPLNGSIRLYFLTEGSLGIETVDRAHIRTGRLKERIGI